MILEMNKKNTDEKLQCDFFVSHRELLAFSFRFVQKEMVLCANFQKEKEKKMMSKMEKTSKKIHPIINIPILL